MYPEPEIVREILRERDSHDSRTNCNAGRGINVAGPRALRPTSLERRLLTNG